jgi:hypothetical protein
MFNDTVPNWIDYTLATIIGLCLAMGALAYFDVLTH